MSDVMLFGVLRMPYDMAMATETSRHQYWQRGQQAIGEIERLRMLLEAGGGRYWEGRCLQLEKALREIISEEEQFNIHWAADVARAALGEKKDD